MKAGKVSAVWTTNFDRMIEDAAGQVFGTTSRLVVASIDSSKVAYEAMNESRWPLLVKLHGDFQSRRSRTRRKNCGRRMQCCRALLQACQRFGLAVAGYSGRDASVMETFEKVVANRNSYPSGLFWFHRPESPLLPRVQRLLDNARDAGAEADVIEVETFDELFGDILSLFPTLPLTFCICLTVGRLGSLIHPFLLQVAVGLLYVLMPSQSRPRPRCVGVLFARLGATRRYGKR